MMQTIHCKTVCKNGMTLVQINNELYEPVSFKTFRPSERNISDFYNSGIRLINILTSGINCSLDIPYSPYGESWLDDETYNMDVIDQQIDFFISQAPEAYFSLMITLDTRQWWLDKHKGYPNSFTSLAQMEADKLWRNLACKYMQTVLRHVEDKYGDRFYGYFLLCGGTTEWLSEESMEEPSDISINAYKKWKQSDSPSIPTKVQRENSTPVFLENQDLISYRKFENEQRSDTILWFASKAQQILGHKKLLGVYFGYVFELAGPRLWNTSHIDYERIFTSNDIDMIASPVSYESRKQNCGSQPMITHSTLSLHKKICFYEHDQTTCITPDTIEGKFFVHPNKAKTIEEDINLIRRDYMFAMANGCAIWWFDMFGGWFYDQRFMHEISRMNKITKTLANHDSSHSSEIAVFIDPQSLYFVNKHAGLNDMLFSRQRLVFSMLGASYDLFSTCDASNINIDQYKLFIFLNQFHKNFAVENLIAQSKQNGKSLLFMYAYNAITDQGFDLDAMSYHLDMQVRHNSVPEDKIILINGTISDAGAEYPCYYVEPSTDITILGHYQNSGQAALVYKHNNDSTVFFSGLGNLDAPALREILDLAGVHRYILDSSAIVYVNQAFLGICHLEDKAAEIHLHEDGVYVDVFNRNKKYISKCKKITVPFDGIKAKLLLNIANISQDDLIFDVCQ